MASIVSSLLRRLTGLINPPRYQSPFFVFTQIQLARAYYVAAELKIAELVSQRARTATELAEAAGCQAEPLFRMLRLLAAFGVFAEDDAGKFRMTRRANILLADAPGSIRQWILFEGQSELWQGYAHTLEAVKTGVPALQLATGKTFYDCVGERPALAQAFYGALANWSDLKCQAVLQAYDFGRFESVVDVGGGQGKLVAGLLQAHPRLQGTVFDLDDTIRQVRDKLAGAPFADRCHFVSGSFFEAIPPGADVYILNDVLGDWTDEQATAILGTCLAAMKPEAVLLIADTLIDPRSGRDRICKMLDVERSSFFGVGKRTQAEFEALLARTGLRLTKVHPTSVIDLNLLEVRVGSRANRSTPTGAGERLAPLAGDQ